MLILPGFRLQACRLTEPIRKVTLMLVEHRGTLGWGQVGVGARGKREN